MTEHKEHVVGVGTYMGIITSLMVLTAITVIVAFMDFGAMNTVTALGIALVKMLLVASVFMHLKYSARICWMYAGCGIVFFMILMAFVMGDYAGREWQYTPQPWEAARTPVAAAPSAASGH